MVTGLDTRMPTYLWNDKLRTYLNNSTNSPLLPSNTPTPWAKSYVAFW